MNSLEFQMFRCVWTLEIVNIYYKGCLNFCEDMFDGVSRNYVFVQHGSRAVLLQQMTVGVCLRIDTGVILNDYVMTTVITWLF